MRSEQVIDRINERSNTDVIAECFSAAANTYHHHNSLQKISAQKLLNEMSPSGVLLDIGCGPGTDFSYFIHLKHVIALDIAQGMLDQVERHFPTYQTICSDAKAIPLAQNSVDTVYSNLALQWCDDIKQSFDSTALALKSGGNYHLAIVAQDSLPELTELGFRANSFRSLPNIASQFDPEVWRIKSAAVETITVYFTSLKALLYSIKGVGASIHTGASPSNSTSSVLSHGIRGRGDWQKQLVKAERMRQEAGLPLTYHIARLHIEKR
ncbi:methyltransferase domain-containing protein [Shewanella sp. VB17]|uniref:methyltransferase domain-containing protein n=1 Tax=Shewanella sp. VB17 TaxID=2739432 RepID=UPI0015658684|nr:methyltransferase domain-containing protein [Shewanella sp. VB17]NRD73583.1 methyltransferase domain-containing protein [Shewanella sp. VB17]